MIFGIIGFIIAATTTTTAPRYLSIFFMTGGLSSSFTVLLAWVGSTFARPFAKRAVAYAFVNALGNSEYSYYRLGASKKGLYVDLLTRSGADLVAVRLPQVYRTPLCRGLQQ